MRRAERAGAAGGLAGIGDARDFPAGSGLEQAYGIDATVSQLAVQVEVVLGPDNGDGAMDKHCGIPDSLEPDVLRAGQKIGELFVAHAGWGAVVLYGEKIGVGREK